VKGVGGKSEEYDEGGEPSVGESEARERGVLQEMAKKQSLKRDCDTGDLPK
jgi:hypothetical protein